MTEIIKLMEIIGTIAFSISGALVAIGARLDIFGVCFLACVTAFGGGILRDVFLGANPPAIFNNLPIFLLSLGVSVMVFVVSYITRKSFDTFKTKTEHINNIFDAVGLSAFAVIGSEAACTAGFLENGFLVVFLGMITGVGGGIFRDVLIHTTPYVLKKHIYALAAIFGSLVYFILRKYTNNINLASSVSVIIIFLIRMLATKYRWSLPKIHINEDTDK